MCGRYYLDEDLEDELVKVVRQVESALAWEKGNRVVYPTNFAPVIGAGPGSLALTEKRWGYPGFSGKGVIFNARAESVLEKRMFAQGIQKGRVVIPARGFYEWNPRKEKLTFKRPDGGALYLAGFYDRMGGDDCFVILTTEANASMAEIHPRMPLILEADQIHDWVLEDGRTRELLGQRPGELEHSVEYEQLRLF